MNPLDRIAALEAEVRDLRGAIELLKSGARGSRQKLDALDRSHRRDHQRLVILEHAPGRKPVAREIFRPIRPGGTLAR